MCSPRPLAVLLATTTLLFTAVAVGVVAAEEPEGLGNRFDADDPVEFALQVSELTETTMRVVLARDDDFADSLAGTTLAGPFGVLLFTPSGQLDPRVRAEVNRILFREGEVFLLGGAAALSPAVEQALRDDGHLVTRLSGPSRVETAIAVADRLAADPGSTDTVALARADHWADSVTGGAWAASAGAPVLLTGTDALHPAVDEALRRLGTTRTVLLGGTAALSAAVEQQVPGPERVSGPTRSGTAIAIAERLWGDHEPPELTNVRSYVVLNGYADNGWAFGLASAPLAAAVAAPLLLATEEGATEAERSRIDGCRTLGTVWFAGSAELVPESLRQEALTCDRAPVVNLCTALSRQEATELFGSQWMAITGNLVLWLPEWQATPPDRSCWWTSDTVMLDLLRFRSAEMWDPDPPIPFASLHTEEWEQVDGLGEEAVVNPATSSTGGMVFVRLSDDLTYRFHWDARDPADRPSTEQLIDLVERMLPRLPGA